MIQRIQSIYLLLAAAFLGLSLALPMAVFSHEGSVIATMRLCGIYNVNDHLVSHLWAIPAVTTVSLLGALVAIFLYKNRRKQIAVTNGLMLLILVLLVLGIIAAYNPPVALGSCTAAPAYGIVFPFLAYVSTWLSRRAIRKDEELVRSAERFR